MILHRHQIALLSILGLLSVLLLRELDNNSLAYPDADRILMDGVFLHDLLHDRPFGHLYDYALSYYAQYPALSIGYRPPFLPFLEAIANSFLGVNIWSSRLVIVVLALLGAGALYQLVARVFDRNTALLTLLLYATTPFIIQWGWYTMSELPVLSLALLSCYYYHCYTESNRAGDLYGCTISFVLAVWTKQTAIFLGPFFLLNALFAGQLISYGKRKEFWWTVMFIVIALSPLAAMTVWLGKKNIAQSVGTLTAPTGAVTVKWHRLALYWQWLYQVQLGTLVFCLALLGMVLSVFYRGQKTRIFFLLIICTYGFFTYLVAKDPRYTIFWLPAFCLFATLPVYYLRPYRLAYGAACALIAVIAVQQTISIYQKPFNYATGYESAARLALQHSHSPRVFFDGVNNGYFIYFMRALDPQRRHFVLRGDKLLSSSSVFSSSEQAVHAHTIDDIKKIISALGVELIVVESRNEMGMAIHGLLRDYLQQGPFQLLYDIPVSSTRQSLSNQHLLIYRFLDAQPITQKMLQLQLPIVGKTLNVPITRP